jgi:hypothetical protein
MLKGIFFAQKVPKSTKKQFAILVVDRENKLPVNNI